MDKDDKVGRPWLAIIAYRAMLKPVIYRPPYIKRNKCVMKILMVLYFRRTLPMATGISLNNLQSTIRPEAATLPLRHLCPLRSGHRHYFDVYISHNNYKDSKRQHSGPYSQKLISITIAITSFGFGCVFREEYYQISQLLLKRPEFVTRQFSRCRCWARELDATVCSLLRIFAIDYFSNYVTAFVCPNNRR